MDAAPCSVEPKEGNTVRRPHDQPTAGRGSEKLETTRRQFV
jgi:hypothetical protein